MNPLNLIAPILDAGSKVVDAVTRPKREKAEALSKIQAANADTENSLQLSDSEWAKIKAALEGGTWKDEFVTVSVVGVFLLSVPLAAVYAAMSGDTAPLTGLRESFKIIQEMGVSVGELLTYTVLAALSINVFRRIT